jgi:hypothetical protein
MKSLHEPAEPITSPLKAIRANCVDCMGGQRSLVRDCDLRAAPSGHIEWAKTPFVIIEISPPEQRSEIGERLRRGREQA